MTNDASLDREILDAQEKGDHRTPVNLYSNVADNYENAGNTDAACYFRTIAYVFALEEGMDEAEALHMQLVEHGRDV